MPEVFKISFQLVNLTGTIILSIKMQNTFEGPYSNFCNSQIENGKAITMRELKKKYLGSLY